MLGPCSCERRREVTAAGPRFALPRGHRNEDWDGSNAGTGNFGDLGPANDGVGPRDFADRNCAAPTLTPAPPPTSEPTETPTPPPGSADLFLLRLQVPKGVKPRDLK